MLPDRFWARVTKTDTCWLWAGATANGYGKFDLNGKHRRAHRLAYEDAVGAIPDGLQLDHLCRVRNCVNPAHLEVVDHRTNTLRGVGPTAINARRTECIYGHPLTGSNLYQYSDGHRDCRSCRRTRERIRQRMLSAQRRLAKVAQP